MKIIGKTKDGFILQAEKDEVYKLIGFDSEYSATHLGRDDSRRELSLGEDVQVAAMYSQLYSLVHATNCIRSLQKEAQEMADHLSKHPAVPILENVHIGSD